MGTQAKLRTVSDKEQILCKTAELPRKPLRHRTNRFKEAIKLKGEGLTYAAIAEILGVTPQRVQQICRPPIQVYALLKKRSGNRCERCETAEPVHVHHIRYELDPWDLSTLLYLCSACHRIEHAQAAYFTFLPPGLGRRAAAIEFIQPYLSEHLRERYCQVCGAAGALRSVCKKCRKKHEALAAIKACLVSWQNKTSKHSEHHLSQAICLIRKFQFRPEDLAPLEAK